MTFQEALWCLVIQQKKCIVNKTLIIAEAGVNHNGDIRVAKQLIDVAETAGVDYVKFQTFKASKLVSVKAQKADYQITNTGVVESQLNMLRNLELSEANHEELIIYCNEKNVEFLSTGFDIESLNYLYKIGIRLFKVPSGEITNLPYLQKVASLANEIILSTGMCYMSDVEAALEVIRSIRSDIPITVLHCNTEYPTPMIDVNLRAMLSIQERLKVQIGYSDHTLGFEIPIAAVALGAVVIEKHFTLDRTLPGPDHAASLEPEELVSMVKAIRNIELALGSSVKEPSISETKNIAIARKSIHLNVSLNKGAVIKESDLIMLRPGDGISPMELPQILGKTINKDLHEGSKLSLEDFE
jgi:N,N'-diacetyllegionaminate synthase